MITIHVANAKCTWTSHNCYASRFALFIQKKRRKTNATFLQLKGTAARLHVEEENV